MRHLWRSAAQRPCPVRKQFNVHQVERKKLKPGDRIFGSETENVFSAEDDCQLDFYLNRTSTGDRSDQIGFVDDRRKGARLIKSLLVFK